MQNSLFSVSIRPHYILVHILLHKIYLNTLNYDFNKFFWDVCSVEFSEVLTSLVLGHETSWHLSTVGVGSGADSCRTHLSITEEIVTKITE